MGRDHHISLDTYIHRHNAEYLIKKANEISSGKFVSGFAADYAKTRCGICFYQERIDYIINEHKYWLYDPEIHMKHLLPQEETRRLKDLRKRLSVALNKLDAFMESKISGK